MSLAWGGLVLLVTLLQGFLFFVGLYFPEEFTRETEQRSPLGQLAGVLLVSLLVHAAMWWAVGWTCGSRIPCISAPAILQAVTLESLRTSSAGATALMDVAKNFETFATWIIMYALLTCTLGTAMGWFSGWMVVSGRWRFLSRHPWVYSLRLQGNLTIAYVMSDVQCDHRVLMYQGFLQSFGLRSDGRFSYVILSDPVRYYMLLESDAPRTTSKNKWLAIGAGEPGTRSLSSKLEVDGAHRISTFLALEGDNIANVVFERFEIERSALKLSTQDFEVIFNSISSEIAGRTPPNINLERS
jgi:hypothetical protein